MTQRAYGIDLPYYPRRAFAYWCVAHGMHYQHPGMFGRFHLITRKAVIESLAKEWRNSLVWC